MIWLDIRAFYSGNLEWWVNFLKGLVYNGKYNSTEFLQVERFKFVFFPVIQKELKNIKGHQNSRCFRQLLQPTNEGRSTGRQITLLRKIFSEYLHEFNYDDFLLVKEKCCADEGNTYWVCYNEFFELASILTEENGLFEAYSSKEALLLLQELYHLILQI